MERQLIRRGLNRIIWLPILTTLLYSGLLLWQLNRMIEESGWLQHTSQVIALSNHAEQHVAFQEASLRGYLLTRLRGAADTSFIAEFEEDDAHVDTALQQIHQMVIDNTEQTKRLDTLLQAYWNWEALATQSLRISPSLVLPASRLTGALHPPFTMEHSDSGFVGDSSLRTRRALMARMRLIFDRLNQSEVLLFQSRSARFKRGTALLTISITLLTILLGVIIGLSARKQAKGFVYRFGTAIDEARQSNELLQTTILSIADAIIVADLSKRVTIMNPRAEELTGWTRKEAIGRSVDDVFRVAHESGMSPIENPISRVFREERMVERTNQTVLLSRTGVHYPIDDSAAPIRGAEGKMVGAVLVFRDVSLRRESEMESRKREREFRALIENAPDVIIRYARDMRIEYANPAIEHMLGIAPNAMLGKTFREVGIPEEVYAPWEKAVEDVFVFGRSIATEIHYQTLHGYRKYQARLVPETDEHGIQSVISIARDITDIKETEDRLRDSEQRFRGIVESSPDAFFLLRAVRNRATAGMPSTIVDFTFEYLNHVAATLTTIPMEESIGKKLTEVYSGERSREFFEHYRRVVESGEPLVEEYAVHGPYVKKARWLRSMYVPIGDDLAITTTDITSRKATEADLLSSEHRYHRLVDNLPEPIFSTGPTGLFTYANPFIREMSGYKDDDLSQLAFADMVAEGYRDRVKRHFYRQFLSKAPISYIEAPFVTKSGSERWLAVTTTIRIKNGDVEGFDCVATDITDKKKMESELSEARSRLANIERGN